MVLEYEKRMESFEVVSRNESQKESELEGKRILIAAVDPETVSRKTREFRIRTWLMRYFFGARPAEEPS